MKRQKHFCLIHVIVDLMNGRERAQEILSRLAEFGEIVSLSSVYKRYLTEERVDLNARMEFVAKCETSMSVDQTLQLVSSLSRLGSPGLQNRGLVDLTILVFDDQILLSPRLTLPYPLLHQDALIARCSAEAWGDYEHPIYQKNLNEIAAQAPSAKQAEFYCQGSTLKG
jgi:7,8-dihydro-6-hydroxymethylpterin-pyrophosphokinase